MNGKEITKRITRLMQEDPDGWTISKPSGNSSGWLRHKALIDVRHKGSYRVDLGDTALVLNWWNHRTIRKAACALIREKSMRAIDRHELLGAEE